LVVKVKSSRLSEGQPEGPNLQREHWILALQISNGGGLSYFISIIRSYFESTNNDVGNEVGATVASVSQTFVELEKKDERSGQHGGQSLGGGAGGVRRTSQRRRVY
jgi:hypothetical protein